MQGRDNIPHLVALVCRVVTPNETKRNVEVDIRAKGWLVRMTPDERAAAIASLAEICNDACTGTHPGCRDEPHLCGTIRKIMYSAGWRPGMTVEDLDEEMEEATE